MSRFDRLQRRVDKRERLLEGRYEQVQERKRVLSKSWREAWTPGRIVIAGLVAGFFMGRAEPVKIAVKSGNLMQIVSLLSGLFAGAGAQEAADQAGQAAGQAGRAARAADQAADGAQTGAQRSAA
ncbi:hypothetical protein J5226_08190 [Lysobacter sp. K5869]|uniref:hypothetical protein n=1 Tax=Lysobacter sp. K5869 TaxID=2820808 RepID=UPI001C0611CC|nr:hypothetical protein [Lysobacter sp. K5869]QWP78356.1 hypothetical protein J5226_08190 [Lysobacter sp. K5869]